MESTIWREQKFYEARLKESQTGLSLENLMFYLLLPKQRVPGVLSFKILIPSKIWWKKKNE